MFRDHRLRRTALVALAAALAVAPYLGARALFEGHIRAEAAAELDDVAAGFVARATRAIDQGVEALGRMADAGAAGCSAADLDLLRMAASATFAVRAVGVVDAAGIGCNQGGERLAIAESSPPIALPGTANVHLQVVRLGSDRDRSLMLSWPAAGGSLVAVIPAQAAALDILPARYAGAATGGVLLSDGTLLARIGTGGASGAASTDASVTGSATAASYPVGVRLTVPYALFRAEATMLSVAINVAGAALALLGIALIPYALRRPPANENAVRDAIARNEFVPFYQPVIDIRHGRLMGCEVLIRWRKPDGTIVGPSQFIALAEATGLAIPMTRALMLRARDELNHAYGDRPHLKLSINLFHDHFATPGIVSDIRGIFGPSRIAFDQLVLEVTERNPLPDNAATRDVIAGLQALGARVALDDAGTGHSGLANLQRLGLDVLKIDKLFIDVITKSGQPATVADSLIRLGQDLGMEVVAEGVEHLEQVEYLRARGVFAAQGYLFAPALPGPSFLRLIESMEPALPKPANDSRPRAGRASA